MQAKIRIGSDPYLVGSVADFTFKWGINAGLVCEDAVRFTMAVNELITDVVLFAFPEEEGECEMLFQQEPSYLEIIVKETGIPFDPDMHPYDSNKALNDGNFDGAGFEIIRSMCDAFVFLNHGKQGKEFRLLKKLPEGNIIDVSTEAETAEEAKDVEYNYSLHHATSEDAEAISKLIYRVYKNTYTKDVMYYPKMVERAIKHKERFGVLIRTNQDQDVIGFFAILRTTDSLIGEIGEAAVDMKHRRKGLMSMMISELIAIAERKGLLGLFGEAVTVHTVSQKVNYRYGMGSTALLLGMFPNALYKGLNETSEQNVSVIIDFLHLNHEKEKYCYLPDRYKKIAKKIYENLGIKVNSIRTDSNVPFTGASQTDLKIDYEGKNALLVVQKYGEDFIDVVRQTEEDLRRYDINVMLIDLPLDRVATKISPDMLRDEGFIFSGIMPLFHEEKDYLRMQKPFCKLDFNQIYAYTVMAKKLKRFIIKEWDEIRTEKQTVQS